MTNDIAKSIWQGTFKVGNVDLKCHVLSDRSRVIEEESIMALFAPNAKYESDELLEFAKWSKSKDD